MQSIKTLYFKLVLVSLFWGGTFIAARLAADSFDPYVGAFGRFLTASIFLAIVLWQREGVWPRLTKGQWLLVIAGSLTGIIAYNLFFFSGMRIIEANRASLIIALNPVVIMSAAAVFGMERMTSARAAGTILALTGVAIVLTRGDLAAIKTNIGLGELLIGGCVLSWSTYTLIGRKLLQQLSPLAITTYASILGCLGLLIPASLRMTSEFSLGWTAWIPIIYLGLFGTGLAFVWYYDGIKSIGPTRAGIFINLVPAWGVLLSAWLLDEYISIATIIDGVFIIAGVLLTNFRRRQPAASSS